MPTRTGPAIPLVAVNGRIDPKAGLARYSQVLGTSMREATEEALRSLIKGMHASGASGDTVSEPDSAPAEGLTFRRTYRQGPNFYAIRQQELARPAEGTGAILDGGG